MKIVVDAEGSIIGRVGSYVAKQALLGNEVAVINCEKAIMSGNPVAVIETYHHLIKETGNIRKGPFVPRRTDMFVKRIIRRMLPNKKTRGVDALARIRVYRSIPEEFKGKGQKVPGSEKKLQKSISIQDLCHALGGKS